MDERPTFMVNNRIYVSAGVIPYTVDSNGNYYFLLQRITSEDRRWTYEDLGGKSQIGDTCIQDVAFRACCEETNTTGPLTEEYLLGQLNDHRSVIYEISDIKYMLYMIYVPSDFKDTADLSVCSQDRKPCVIEWVSYKSLMELDDAEMHPRLMPSEFKYNLPLILAHPTGLHGKYF